MSLFCRLMDALGGWFFSRYMRIDHDACRRTLDDALNAPSEPAPWETP